VRQDRRGGIALRAADAFDEALRRVAGSNRDAGREQW